MKQIFSKNNKLECKTTCEDCLKMAKDLEQMQVECKDARDWAKSINVCGAFVGLSVGIISYKTLMDGDVDMLFAYAESLALAASTYALVVVAPVARYFAKKQQISGLLKKIHKCEKSGDCEKIKTQKTL